MQGASLKIKYRQVAYLKLLKLRFYRAQKLKVFKRNSSSGRNSNPVKYEPHRVDLFVRSLRNRWPQPIRCGQVNVSDENEGHVVQHPPR